MKAGGRQQDWAHPNSIADAAVGERVNSSSPMLKLGAHDKSCTAMKQSNTAKKDKKISNWLRSVNITPKLRQ
jgi:hypothetical protein